MAQKKADSSSPTHIPTVYLAVPRRWLVVLIAILMAPWIALAALWIKPVKKSGTEIGDSMPVKAARAGKWGNLTLVPIVISPPMELVFTDYGLMPRPTWFFPGVDAERVARMLQSAGVPDADVQRLRAGVRFEPRISGVVLEPDAAWVRSLAPRTRAGIYRLLARSGLNRDQERAFRYPGANPAAWLSPSLISSHTRELIEPLIYRDGGYMLFADVELIRAEIGSGDEMRRLSKALFQQPTVIARLSVDNAADLDALVEYWGRGGRRTEIRPLLESVAGGSADRFIDVIHLLPPFARDHLYCYPKLSAADLDRPEFANCLWTSLNFFLPNPDDRFMKDDIALKTIKEDYFVVESDFELGDIVVFLDEKGNLFHAAVYIADNLLFSKNGISAMAPWTLMSLDDVKGYYRWRSENPRLIFHRRKNS